MHKIQGRARVWRLVIGLAVMMCAQAGIVSAGTFSDLSFSRLTEDYDQYKPKEILVRFTDAAGRAHVTGPFTTQATRSALADRVLAGATVKRDLNHVISGLALVQLPSSVSVLDAVSAFTGADQVLYAEPNYRLNLALMPSDPLFPDQWALNNLGLGRGLLENADINAPEGWDIQVEAVIDDEPIIVAILDTGVDYNHPDIWENMWVEQGIYVPEDVNLAEDPNNIIDPETDPNFWVFDYGIDVITGGIIDDDPNDHLDDGEPMDLHYHGTMVAGIIGALHNNDEGIAGVCSVVTMLAVRVVDVNDNDGTTVAIDTAAVTEGLMGALGKGAKVINMSFSTPSFSLALYNAISSANDQGVVVVASAGNSSANTDFSAAYPAAFDLENIISVMATDGQDQVASYSNYGLETVDLAAPGGDFLNDDGILTTTPQEENAAMAAVLPDPITTMYARGDGAAPQGTSMAAPHVTGAVALAMAVNPALTPTQIRQIITHPLSVDLLDDLDGLCVSGGRLNLEKFLNACRPGDVYNVNKDAWYTSIQDAIKAASPGDEVVAQSDRAFWEAIDFSGKNILLRSGDLTDAPDAIGAPDPDSTIISAHFTDFDLQPTVTFKTGETASAILRGFTVSDGLRGVMVNSASPTIDDCIVSNNEGNGIYCQIGAGPTITGTRIMDNASADVRFIVIAGFAIEVPADGAGVACMVMSSASLTECEITNNKSAGSGGGVYCDDSSSAEVNQSIVADNSALDGWGGGVCSDGGSVKMEGTTLTNNYSEWEGGGLYVGAGSALVKNCSFLGNEANLDGGGMFCEMEPQVFLWDTIFTANRTQFSGGALGCRDTASMIEIKNCLVTDNISEKDDGAGFGFRASSPSMTNCTFVGNDCSQFNLEGGAVFCRENSDPSILNCIFNDNNDIAVVAYDPASEPVIDYCLFFENEQGDYGDSVTERARMSDPNTAHLVPGEHNINKDPMFVPGRMGPYYLSQYEAGQILSVTNDVVDPNMNPAEATSPAVGAGSDTAENLGMTLVSTRTDNTKDSGRVDIGFHYDDPEEPVEYDLKTATNPSLATIVPDAPFIALPFTQFSQVLVTVTVNDPNKYRFKAWSGTDDDTRVDLDANGKPAAVQQTVLTMDGNKDVIAVFETITITLVVGVDGMPGDILPGYRIPVPRDEVTEITVAPHDNAAKVEWTDNSVPNGVLGIPIFSTMRTISVKAEPPFKVNPRGDEYKIISARLFLPNTIVVRPTQSLDEAVDRAVSGDEILVWPGTYSTPGDLLVLGKNITIRSVRPDDPDVVALTVIERGPGGGLVDSAFEFVLNDPRTVLEGFTLRGFQNVGINGAGGTEGAPDGVAGVSTFGGAIRCLSASPTIRNLVIEDCAVTGGNGGAGFDGNDDFPMGGNGGWPGVGAGGGIACLSFSDPTITNVVFRNCQATGGNAGDGGDAGNGGLPGEAGGWYTNPFPSLFAPNFSFLASSGGIGGAAYVDPSSSPIFKDCVFENCSTGSGISGVIGAGAAGVPKPVTAVPLDTAGGAVFVGGTRVPIAVTINGVDIEILPISQAQFLNCEFTSNFTGTPATGGAQVDSLTGFGGAVAVSEAMEPTFSDCSFTLNTSSAGGALASEDSLLVVEDSVMVDNDSFQGGAAYLFGGAPQLINSRLLSNTAVQALSADPTDPNSAAAGTTGEGGAIFAHNSEALIQDCIIQNNNAGLMGGGLEITGAAQITLKNNLITDNAAGHMGGGIGATFYARPEIRNCTIVGNTVVGTLASSGFGGGLHLGYGTYARVVDSIIWNNVATPRDPNNNGDQIALFGGGIDPNFARLSGLKIINSDIGPGATVSGPGSGGVQDFLVYGEFPLSIEDISFGIPMDVPIDTFGVDGWIGTDGQSRIVVYNDTGDPNEPAEAHVYTVSLPAGSDPDAHPLNPGNQAPVAVRTFEEERRFVLDVNIPLLQGTEFYVEDMTSDIYLGVDPNNGIRRYVYSPGAFNMASFGPAGNYVFDANVVGPIPTRANTTWSLAYDPNEQIWYTLATDPNIPGTTEVWRHLPDPDPNGLWEIAFTYPATGRDYIEFVDGYLIMINATGTELRKYSQAGSAVGLYQGAAALGQLRALGHGALGHYWASSQGFLGGTVIELGGGFLQTLESRAGQPVYVDAGSIIQGWDPVTETWDFSTGNINLDPLFTDGYFLSQIGAGQAEQSPAVDVGTAPLNDPNVNLDPLVYVTRTDGGTDEDRVDMGYHSQVSELVFLELLLVDETGAPVDPNEAGGVVTGGNRFYLPGSAANLLAVPDPNENLRPAWLGTDDDASTALANTVTMMADQTVTVQFVPNFYQVTASVLGAHGSVEIIGTREDPNDPNNMMYMGGQIQLVAHPDTTPDPYRVKAWTGTGQDPAWMQSVLTLVLDRDLNAQVEFEVDKLQTLIVPEQYTTIEQAISAALPVARVIVSQGVHFVSSSNGINFQGKQIELMSTDPNDPVVVADTIIDAGGTRDFPRRAFEFNNGEDPNTLIAGFTIRNGYQRGPQAAAGRPFMLTPEPYEPINNDDNPPPRAERGRNAQGVAYGGGILCTNASSPRFVNCIIHDCMVTGGQGGDGAPGNTTAPPPNWQYLYILPDSTVTDISDGQWGGHGGAGSGTGYGGAIACLEDSQPSFINCVIKDNDAFGGRGGQGGDGGYSTGSAESYGGNGGDAFGFGVGGGVYADGTSSPVFNDCQFINNVATSALPGKGGLVGPGASVLDPRASNGLRGTMFSEELPVGGAAYYDAGNSLARFDDCVFSENKAWETHYTMSGIVGGLVSIYWNINFYDADLKSHVDTAGGAIYCASGAAVDLDNCRFENHAGGAIYLQEECSLDVNDCHFVGNELSGLHDPEYPGRDSYEELYFFNGSYFSFFSGFSFQQTAFLGAGLYVGPDCYDVRIRNTEFLDNKSMENGGAIHLSSNAELEDCRFAGNKAFNYGGAIHASYVFGGLNQLGYVDPFTGFIIQFFNPITSTPVAPSGALSLSMRGCTFSGNESATEWNVDKRGYWAERYRDYIYSGGIYAGTQSAGDAGNFGWGGAIYAQDYDVKVKDSHLIKNQAKNGGALYMSMGQLHLDGGSVRENRAIGVSGLIPIGDVESSYRFGILDITDWDGGIDIGGGIALVGAPATIENALFQANRAEGKTGAGGAINFYGGGVEHIVRNCLLIGNEAEVAGGAISAELFATPKIESCTFADNQAGKIGGALFFDALASTIPGIDPVIRDSIFQNNSNIAVAEEELTNSVLNANLFHGNEDGDYAAYDADAFEQTAVGVPIADLNDPNNVGADPQFTTGPLGNFYLAQVDAGQAADSPALDAGTGLAADLGLDTLTTAITGTGDSDAVDLGFHYPDHNDLPLYALTVKVIGNGQVEVDPDAVEFLAGLPVTLTAIPEKGWLVDQWAGTVDDVSSSSLNTVIMDGAKEVTVRFRQPRVFSAETYQSIQHAIDAAEDGDIVRVPDGTYMSDSFWVTDSPLGSSTGLSAIIIRKGITLIGGDVDAASNTILRMYDIYITSSDAVVESFTFEISQMHIRSCSPTIRNCRFVDTNWLGGTLIPSVDPFDGYPGTSLNGGALDILDGSPKIQNCLFSGITITGGDGEDGDNGSGGVGFDGGWGGWAYGGAVYAGYNSDPVFEDCHFEDCAAIGGNGGDGAFGGRGGSWEWADSIETGAYSSPDWTWWGGWQWGPYDVNGILNMHIGIGDYTTPTDRVSDIGYASLVDAYPGNSWGINPAIYDDLANILNYGEYFGYYQRLHKKYWKHSGYGGAVYFEFNCAPRFVNCTFNNNSTEGGTSGIGGPTPTPQTSRIPSRHMNIPNYGGTIYATYGCDVTLENCTIEYGIADRSLDPNSIPDPNDPTDPNLPHDIYLGYGGAIACEEDSTLRLINSKIASSEASVGGALYMSDSELIMENTEITDSTAYHGGAVYATEDTTGQILGSTIARNTAEILEEYLFIADPNALDPNDPNAVLALLPFDPGQIRGEGGGLNIQSSPIDIVDTIVTENWASGSGGAIFLAGNDQTSAPFEPLLKNCLITDNRAAADGGGISVQWTAKPILRNCTITENRVDGTLGAGSGLGGGLYLGNLSSAEVIDSIIWGNEGVDGAQIAVGTHTQYVSRPSALYVTHSIIGPDYDPNTIQAIDMLDQAQAGGGSGQVRGGGPAFDPNSVQTQAIDPQPQAQPGPSASGDESDEAQLLNEQEIYSRFDAGQERVKVLVSLYDNKTLRTTTDWTSSESKATLRENMAARQKFVLMSMKAAEFELRYQCDNLPIFSAEVTRKGLQSLMNNTMVQGIEPVRQTKVMLKQALSLGNAEQIRHTYGGKGVSVAIVDTGVDYNHAMLGGGGFPNDKVIGGYDTGDQDPDPLPFDSGNPSHAHGTACAGIAAGTLGEFGDYAGGVAPEAKIYAIRADSDEFPGMFFTDAEVRAWDWCITHQYDDPANPIMVISNSWGGQSFTDAALADALNSALAQAAFSANAAGITVLAASGNNGWFNAIGSPAALSRVISVGALEDFTGRIMWYSNRSTLLDVYAPADPVYTTDMVGPAGYDASDYYAAFNGTSSACPFAAGTVACIQSAAKEKMGRFLTPDEIRTVLVNTGDPIIDPVVDLQKPAVNLAMALKGPFGPPIHVAAGSVVNLFEAPQTQNFNTWDPSWDPESGNLTADPLFTGGYYLSRKSIGQSSEDSPAVDAGSADVADPNVALAGYTTSTDGVADIGPVDMGYHYDMGLTFYRLTAEVVPVPDPNDPNSLIMPGEVDPNVAVVYEGIGSNKIALAAFPDEGWKVKQWIGTDDDSLTGPSNQVTVQGDTVVQVEFVKATKFHFSATVLAGADGLTHGTVQALLLDRDGEPNAIDANGVDLFDGTVVHLVAVPEEGAVVTDWAGTDNDSLTTRMNTVLVSKDTPVRVTMGERIVRSLTVPGDYPTIQKAIEAASHGDRIVLDPGTYFHGEDQKVMFINKSITITSRNPEDPFIVASTIIDGYTNSGRQWNYLGVMFAPNTDANTVLDGITIQNCGGRPTNGDDGDRDANTPDGGDGGFIWGAGILVGPGASPTIKNCVIRDCVTFAGDGGNGVDATDTQNAGRGGWGGWARGGGVYCAYQSSPTFINCQILDNVARGGDGGDGGNGDAAGGVANYGGNYVPSLPIFIDPNSLIVEMLDEPLWQVWNNSAMVQQRLSYELLLGELGVLVDPNLFASLTFAGINLDPDALASTLAAISGFTSVGYLTDEYHYTALGGGVYCGEKSRVTFKGCEISGNRTFGGLAGIGGVPAGVDRGFEPLYTYELPSFGGGVYCEKDAEAVFEGCTFADNMASTGTDPNGTGTTIDFSQRRDPYLGYGGGLCAEASASIEITDCNFADNVADTGGGVYMTDTLLDVYDSNFISNSALRGAGIFGTQGDFTIGRVDFVANWAETDTDDPNDDNVLTRGAGLAIDSTDAYVYDCNFFSNQAFGSGAGIYLLGQNRTTVLNCLIQYNAAGREGGGIAANMGATPEIRNCTFVHNLAGPTWLGGTDDSGYGGALFAGNGSKCEVIDSLLWFNSARLGTAIATGQVLDYGERNCGSVEISYSDIMVGPNDVFDDCGTIVYGPEVRQQSTEPGFVQGPLGNFYLRNSSRAVDAGSTKAAEFGLSSATTRTDSEPDKGQVDMGYHFPMLEPCSICDLQRDGVIDISDFNVLAQMVVQWRDSNCTDSDDCWQRTPFSLEDINDLAQFELIWLGLECTAGNDWCDGLDVNFDGQVDDGDVNQLSWCWDVRDTRAPLPNPPEWLQPPFWVDAEGHVIQLMADPVEDAWGWDVEYLFDNITGDGHDGSWQSSPSYVDSVATDRAAYSYRFKTRDVIEVDAYDDTTWRHNESEWSEVVVIGSPVDPGPAGPLQLELVGVTDTTITVSTSRLFDEDGVEYQIEAKHEGDVSNSGWIDPGPLPANQTFGVTYTFTFLQPETEYELRFIARDPLGNQSNWSPVIRATTLALINNVPPQPDPMIWSTVADANGFTGEPRAELMPPGILVSDWAAVMTAEIAVDDIGEPVEYFFQCLTNHDFDSGWVADPFYTVMVGRYPGRSTDIGGSQGLVFRVKARDASGNETGWSVEEVTDEAAQAQAAAQAAAQGQQGQGQQGQGGGGAVVGAGGP